MKGKPWNEWRIWLALETYVLLAQEFAWESYTDTFKIYYENKASDVGLNSDEQKLSKWVERWLYAINNGKKHLSDRLYLMARYSKVVNKNLCPYFQWWKFPLTDATIAVCSELPAWVPAVNPLDKYTRKLLDFSWY